MAQVESEELDASEPPIDDESKAALEDVKKKKARHFALIVKGADIVKLIVQKKPIKEAQILAAKKAGFKGVATSGVCLGSGQSIIFEIVGVAGNEPCKTTKLRKFLADHAEMKAQPEFKFVLAADLSSVDVDDLAVTPSAETSIPPASASAEAPPPAPPPAPALDERGRYLAALQKLTPQIKAAVAATPARKAELLGPVADIKRQLDDVNVTNFAPVKQQLANLLRMLKEPSSATVSSDPTEQRTKLTAALNQITPSIKSAVAADPASKESLLQSVKSFQNQLQANQFDDAKDTLTQLVKRLKEIAANKAESDGRVPEGTSVEGPEKAQWEQRFAEFEPRYLAALKTANSEQAGSLRARFAYATEQAEVSQFAKALATLEQMEPLLAAAAKSGGPVDVVAGIVAKRKFLVTRWRQIPGELAAELDSLRDAIEEQVPDEDGEAITAGLQSTLMDFFENMKDAIDSAINQSDGSYTDAQKLISQLRAKISSHPAIALLNRQPFKGVSSVQTILEKALDEVSAALSA